MSNLKERIDYIESEKEWLENRVSSIFSKYCQVYGINEAHGVDSWEIWGDKLEIIQNVSCRGCYDVWKRSLPAEYLYSDDYNSLIERDFQNQQREEEEEKERERVLKAQRREEKAQQREEKDIAEYERLKQKFEGDGS